MYERLNIKNIKARLYEFIVR